MRRFFHFDNFMNYLFLFFVLQIQFVIKGSNAGNTQKPQSSKNTNSKSNQQLQHQQLQQNHIDEDHDMIQIESFEEESKLAESTGQRSVELCVPKASRQFNSNYMSDERPQDKSPESEALALSMLRMSFPPRPKTHSRQSSHGINSGEQTPNQDYDWVETSSETSVSSGIAHKLLLPDDRKYDPIAFEDICLYLESTLSSPMTEEELLTICRRVLKNDYFVKALNLQLYVKNFDHNVNAIKIHDILYAYLGQSGDLMSSRCSSSNSHSTIETPPNSPNQRFVSPEQAQNESEGVDTTEFPDIEIVDGIIKEHTVLHHQLYVPLQFNNLMLRTRMGLTPHPTFFRLHYRHLQPIFGVLDPVKEERSMSEVSEVVNKSDEDESPTIEEID